MGNTVEKTSTYNHLNNAPRRNRLPNFRFSQWSLNSFTENLSIRSFVSKTSQTTTYSTSRPWSRVSRRRWQDSTLNSPWESAKTAWPVSQSEAIFLPEFKIQGDVSEKDFEILESLKKGAFGNVFKVKKRDCGTEYAMKILSKSKVVSEAGINQVKDEVRIQTVCGHNPFIVGCIFHWQSKKYLFIVSTYLDGGEMFDLLQAYTVLPEEVAKIYIAEIALALDFLHNAGVIYRDLKPENILLDNEGHAQLIDFGLSKWLKYGCRTNTICGTLQYMAPEVLEHYEPYGHAVDWWSLGVVACLLLTGKFPAVILRRLLKYQPDKRNDQPRITIPDAGAQLLADGCSCSLPVLDLLERLLQYNSQQRLKSLFSLQSISFYKGFSFADTRSKKISPKQLLRTYFPNGPPSRETPEYNNFDNF